MEELFNQNPNFASFLSGQIAALPQRYHGILFLIFRNLDNSCIVAIAPESVVDAYNHRDICVQAAIELKDYITRRLLC